jgi:hypothetical protein
LLREFGILKQGSMYDLGNVSLVHHVNQALRAHKLFQRDKDYIIKDGKVMLIDEFTGRMMEGRRLSEGLHQASKPRRAWPSRTKTRPGLDHLPELFPPLPETRGHDRYGHDRSRRIRGNLQAQGRRYSRRMSP